jgi:hypothetical protein
MPIQLEFLHEGLGVIYRCEGALGLQHFSDANSRFLTSPNAIRKLKYVIFDAASMEPQFFSPTAMDGIARPPDCIICRTRIVGLVCGARCRLCTRPDVGGIHRGNRLGDEDLSVNSRRAGLGPNSCERQLQLGSSLTHCFNFFFRSRLRV